MTGGVRDARYDASLSEPIIITLYNYNIRIQCMCVIIRWWVRKVSYVLVLVKQGCKGGSLQITSYIVHVRINLILNVILLPPPFLSYNI